MDVQDADTMPNGYADEEQQGIFKDWLFTLPKECPERHEIKRDLLENGAKLIRNLPVVFNKYHTAIHLRPRTFTREEAISEGMDLKSVVALAYVRDSVMSGTPFNLDNYRIFTDEAGPLTQAPEDSQMDDADMHMGVSGKPDLHGDEIMAGGASSGTQPTQSQTQEQSSQQQDEAAPATPSRTGDELATSASTGRRGAARGIKMKLWTREEIQTLFLYIQKQILDEDALSGMRIWKEAEAQNILPGRTAQSMRECYRRRKLGKVARASLLLGGVTPGRPTEAAPDPNVVMEQGVANGIPNVSEIVDHLMECSKRSAKDVHWAIYQASGDFKKARDLLLGKLPDFEPWDMDEDQLIQRLAVGFRTAATESCNSDNERLSAIVNACHEVSTQDRHDLERMLYSRKLEDCAQRAVFLRE